MHDVIFVDDEKELEVLYKLKLKELIQSEQINFHFFLKAEKCLEFLETIDTSKKTIIFTDINMPEMDGLDLLANITAKYKNFVTYMVSAYDIPEYIERSEQLGAEGFFKKPVDFKEIKDVISNFYKL